MNRVGKKLLAYVLGAYIGTGLVEGLWNPLAWAKTQWAAAAVSIAILFLATELWRWKKAKG